MRTAAAVALASALLAAAAVLARPVPYVELVDGRSGRVVWAAMPSRDGPIELGFTHSLYGVPQRELYRIDGDQMRLREVTFGSYDAAAYYDPDPVEPAWHEGTVWRMRVPEDRRMPPAPFRVGYETGHFVMAGRHAVEVAPRIEPGRVAILRGGTRPMGGTLLRSALAGARH